MSSLLYFLSFHYSFPPIFAINRLSLISHFALAFSMALKRDAIDLWMAFFCLFVFGWFLDHIRGPHGISVKLGPLTCKTNPQQCVELAPCSFYLWIEVTFVSFSFLFPSGQFYLIVFIFFFSPFLTIFLYYGCWDKDFFSY